MITDATRGERGYCAGERWEESAVARVANDACGVVLFLRGRLAMLVKWDAGDG